MYKKVILLRIFECKYKQRNLMLQENIPYPYKMNSTQNQEQIRSLLFNIIYKLTEALHLSPRKS